MRSDDDAFSHARWESRRAFRRCCRYYGKTVGGVCNFIIIGSIVGARFATGAPPTLLRTSTRYIRTAFDFIAATRGDTNVSGSSGSRVYIGGVEMATCFRARHMQQRSLTVRY